MYLSAHLSISRVGEFAKVSRISHGCDYWSQSTAIGVELGFLSNSISLSTVVGGKPAFAMGVVSVLLAMRDCSLTFVYI